jgi:hypothetical protein
LGQAPAHPKRDHDKYQVVALDLSKTAVTDAGLKELASLKNLQELVLSNTKVTQDGANLLQKALPACKISAK